MSLTHTPVTRLRENDRFAGVAADVETTCIGHIVRSKRIPGSMVNGWTRPAPSPESPSESLRVGGGPGLDYDHEGDIDLGVTQSAALSARFGVQSTRCGECAVLCAAWL